MTNNKKNPIAWIKQYPVKALIFIFLILIPLIFATVFISTTFKNSTKFYFDKDEAENPIYLNNKDLISTEKLEELLDLKITLKSITLPLEKKVNDEVVYSLGSYRFEVSYEVKAGVNATFNFHWMLDTKWKENRSNPSTLTMSDRASNRDISYNYNLPFTKFGLFKIERPDLFLKITQKPNEIVNGLASEPIIHYYRLDLSQFKPTVTQAT